MISEDETIRPGSGSNGNKLLMVHKVRQEKAKYLRTICWTVSSYNQVAL